jgi:hypothetical protein
VGFVPDDLAAAPAPAIAYLANQLDVAPAVLAGYAARAQIRTGHLAKQQALGFRDAGPAERRRLAAWLLERAMEHERLRTLALQLEFVLRHTTNQEGSCRR